LRREVERKEEARRRIAKVRKSSPLGGEGQHFLRRDGGVSRRLPLRASLENSGFISGGACAPEAGRRFGTTGCMPSCQDTGMTVKPLPHPLTIHPLRAGAPSASVVSGLAVRVDENGGNIL